MDDIPTSLDQLIDQIRETLGSPNEPLAADDDLFTAGLDRTAGAPPGPGDGGRRW